MWYSYTRLQEITSEKHWGEKKKKEKTGKLFPGHRDDGARCLEGGLDGERGLDGLTTEGTSAIARDFPAPSQLHALLAAMRFGGQRSSPVVAVPAFSESPPPTSQAFQICADQSSTMVSPRRRLSRKVAPSVLASDAILGSAVALRAEPRLVVGSPES